MEASGRIRKITMCELQQNFLPSVNQQPSEYPLMGHCPHGRLEGISSTLRAKPFVLHDECSQIRMGQTEHAQKVQSRSAETLLELIFNLYFHVQSSCWVSPPHQLPLVFLSFHSSFLSCSDRLHFY